MQRRGLSACQRFLGCKEPIKMTLQPTADEIELCLAVTNTSAEPLTLYLEPWAEEYPMPVQREFILVGVGPKRGSGLWIEYGDKMIKLSGWTVSVVRVFEGGIELGGLWGKRPPVRGIFGP